MSQWTRTLRPCTCGHVIENHPLASCLWVDGGEGCGCQAFDEQDCAGCLWDDARPHSCRDPGGDA